MRLVTAPCAAASCPAYARRGGRSRRRREVCVRAQTSRAPNRVACVKMKLILLRAHPASPVPPLVESLPGRYSRGLYPVTQRSACLERRPRSSSCLRDSSLSPRWETVFALEPKKGFLRHARSSLTLPNSLAAVRGSACVCGWELRGHAGVPPPPAIPPAPKCAAATRCAPSSALHPLSAWPSSAEITSSSRRRCTTKGWPPPYPS